MQTSPDLAPAYGLRRSRLPGVLAVVAVALTACAGAGDDTPQPTPASTPRPMATASVSPSGQPSESASATSSPTSGPTSSPTAAASGSSSSAPAAPSFDAGGGFSVLPNAAADALFAVPDDCRNLRDGYQLRYPDEWYTNTEIGDQPPCSWFAPTFYEVADPAQRPDEIAIEILRIPGARGYHGEILAQVEGRVATQAATRVEVAGTPDDPSSGSSYEYVIQLGPTAEEGPNLVVRTDTSMGGDYELNKAVLDRMMTTIEFIGSIQ